MGIGAGTGLGGTAVPPQIRESETTAFVQTSKASLGIAPQDTYEVMSFTQQDVKTVFKYDTKASDPMLSDHLLQLRLAKLDREIHEKAWKPIHEELIKKLPEVIKELLITENNKPFLSRDLNFVVLNQLLIATARFIDWINTVSIPPAENTPAANLNKINANLASIALNGALSTFEPEGELGKLLPALEILGKKAAAGEDVKQEFIALSDVTHHLAKESRNEGAYSRAILSTIDIIASSHALENGSPSLLIGSYLVTLRNDPLFEGLISPTLRNELKELNQLKNSLGAL